MAPTTSPTSPSSRAAPSVRGVATGASPGDPELAVRQAEVVAPDAPLFAGGVAEGLRDCISYDTITAADPGWTVLARDRDGRFALAIVDDGGDVRRQDDLWVAAQIEGIG